MKKRVAKILLQEGCVQLSAKKPFTYASGLTGPIYCDNRLLISNPQARAEIAQCFANVLEAESLKPDIIAGLATAGIPHAAWLAELTHLPMIYIRSKAKAHGKQNQVEGRLSAGQKVILVEDLINQGGSAAAGAEIVLAEKAQLVGCLAIVDYQMPAAKQKFASLCPIYALTDFEHLLAAAQEIGKIDAEEVGLLKKWYGDTSR